MMQTKTIKLLKLYFDTGPLYKMQIYFRMPDHSLVLMYKFAIYQNQFRGTETVDCSAGFDNPSLDTGGPVQDPHLFLPLHH